MSKDNKKSPFKLKTLLAIAALAIVGIGTGLSFANSSSTTSISPNGGATDFGTIQDYSTFDDTGVNDTDPSISGLTGQAESIDGGDLMFVDSFSPDSNAVWFNLILDNAGSISNSYNYLNFQLAVYVTNSSNPTSGDWQHVSDVNVSSLSLTNAETSFILEDSDVDSLTDISGLSDVSHVEVVVTGGSSYIYEGQSSSEVSFFLEGREI